MTGEAEKLPNWIGWTRLGIGFAQGLALYWCDLTKDPVTPFHHSILFAALFVPLIIIGGLGAMRPVTLGAWAAAAAVLLFILGWHDVDRAHIENGATGPDAAFLAAAIIVFVGHHLVQAADNANKLIAPYESYFDLGWRHSAQLLLAFLFTLAFWAVLGLGASLFNLIKLDFLSQLIGHTWFSLPATFVTFAAAIHLTDLGSGMVRGVRALGLLLLSWLLPIMTGLVAAFLIALCFTGLQPLWDTRAGATILLSAAAALVVLVNATYQDGKKDHAPAFVVFWSARIAGALLTPLAILAAYALFLRIAQYGYTPERIFASAVLLVGMSYAITYMFAAFSPRWMQPLEIGNIASAYLVLAVGIALFTPIADPARISVADQMQRIESNRTAPDKIDWRFLRFDAGRYGYDALLRLRADTSTPAAQKLSSMAADALRQIDRYVATVAPPQQIRLNMHPIGVVAPANFRMETSDNATSFCRAQTCDGFLIDVTGDGKPDLVLIDQSGANIWAYEGDATHDWHLIGQGRAYGHETEVRAGVSSSDAHAAPAHLSDFVVGGRRVSLDETP